jgi:hypothetical protein
MYHSAAGRGAFATATALSVRLRQKRDQHRRSPLMITATVDTGDMTTPTDHS